MEDVAWFLTSVWPLLLAVVVVCSAIVIYARTMGAVRKLQRDMFRELHRTQDALREYLGVQIPSSSTKA